MLFDKRPGSSAHPEFFHEGNEDRRGRGDLDHCAATWIRFAAKKTAQPGSEPIPREWNRLQRIIRTSGYGFALDDAPFEGDRTVSMNRKLWKLL